MKYALYAFMLLLCGCSMFETKQPEDDTVLTPYQACSLFRYKQKNRLASKVQGLFDAARGNVISFCDADPATQTCVAKAIRLNAKVGATPALIELAKAKVLAVGSPADDTPLYLEHYFNVSHTYPTCRAAKATLDFVDCENALWVTQPFKCNFSYTQETTITATYRIVYIDFKQKLIGAFYEVDLSDGSSGGRSGYALIRFPKDPVARPVNDDLDDVQFTLDENGRIVSYEAPVPVQENEVIKQEEQITIIPDNY